MTPNGDDAQLRSRFATMRRAESERVPPFARFAQPPRAHARSKRTAIAVACVALVALALAARHASRTHEPASMAALAQWTAPTDFLLRTPGAELFATAPVSVPPKTERNPSP